jgi:hypothetical protein
MDVFIDQAGSLPEGSARRSGDPRAIVPPPTAAAR